MTQWAGQLAPALHASTIRADVSYQPAGRRHPSRRRLARLELVLERFAVAGEHLDVVALPGDPRIGDRQARRPVSGHRQLRAAERDESVVDRDLAEPRGI